MDIYNYEQVFGAWDKTSRKMRQAIGEWFQSYYGQVTDTEKDPCQRIAYTVVSKLVRTVFGEYNATAQDPFAQSIMTQLSGKARQATEMSLVGGACYIKPCPGKAGFSFALIPRNNALIFGRDGEGNVTDMGTVECSTQGRYYYTLCERRTVDEKGYLTIENKLYRSLNAHSIGTQVSLTDHPEYAQLSDRYCFTQPVHSVGLVEVKTPMLNCVDGSADGVSVFAPAMGLIRNIDENEQQLAGEFRKGQSRVFASRDLLKDTGTGLVLEDDLFIGLDEDPEQVGITVFSPALRQQSYLERKQEYLRNVESVIGLKRGMLSDTNAEDRTATEISSSAGDYNLTVIDFQRMWTQAVEETVGLCCCLAKLYRMAVPAEQPKVSIDWGNGVLYDEDKTWADYQQMVANGLLKPEIALGWRFNIPAQTQAQLSEIRSRLMPEI